MLAQIELAYYVAHWHSEQLIYRFGTEQVIYNTKKICYRSTFTSTCTNTMEPCSYRDIIISLIFSHFIGLK
jgi:hypothetical protein